MSFLNESYHWTVLFENESRALLLRPRAVSGSQWPSDQGQLLGSRGRCACAHSVSGTARTLVTAWAKPKAARGISALWCTSVAHPRPEHRTRDRLDRRKIHYPLRTNAVRLAREISATYLSTLYPGMRYPHCSFHWHCALASRHQSLDGCIRGRHPGDTVRCRYMHMGLGSLRVIYLSMMYHK